MRLVQRNLQTVYYAKPQSAEARTDENGLYTGEKAVAYGPATEARMNVAPATGNTSLEPYGIHDTFTHVLITDDTQTDFGTDTVFWIGKKPGDGPYNFVVTRVARQLSTSGAVRIYAREVSGT